MEGVVWGAVAGVAFGMFQATNRRANKGVDPFLATFTVILASFVVLAASAAVLEQPIELFRAAPFAFLWFASAGVFNFFLGWTFLVLAQQRVGAARTSVVAGTAPLFGTAIAFLAIGESVRPLALLGVVLVVAGIGVLAGSQSSHTAAGVSPVSGMGFALLTAVSWGVSAVLARHGLDQVPAPMSGVTVGMAASAALYGVGLLLRRARGRVEAPSPIPPRTIALLSLAGLFVATGIGTQWIALGLAPVAIVLALNQLAVPVVLLVAPVITKTPAERLNTQSKLAAMVAVAGTLLIIAARETAG